MDLHFLPSLPLAAERVVERSKDRVSKIYKRTLGAEPTHPTSLRWSTLSPASRKEGKNLANPN